MKRHPVSLMMRDEKINKKETWLSHTKNSVDEAEEKQARWRWQDWECGQLFGRAIWQSLPV